MPATVAVPSLMGSSVHSIRTVVVLPAPLGPRNPKTSPRATVEVDAPDRLDVRLTARTAIPPGQPTDFDIRMR